ncbi:MAG: lipase maturation factor family protein [Candidatus Sulfotelmatobacter sp.]
MPAALSNFIRYLFGSTPDGKHGASNRLIARWLFLRALGLIYFSAFFSLIFQIRGLIGPQGILPAGEYLEHVRHGLGPLRLWYAPTILWLSSGNHMLVTVCVVGMLASLLLVANIWPRAMLFLCFLGYLSFVGAAQDFANYQSDGMLLEAGFISLFLAPAGFLPGWGANSPPPRASVLLLLWEWFRIYFESGAVKLLSGDPTWRNFTAMDEYYQNGPLPSWIGWYVAHLPESFHKATAFATLLMELVLVLMALLPRRWRIACFCIVTVWQVGVILTANYTFLNYLVLILGVLLLDDRLLRRFLPARFRNTFPQLPEPASLTDEVTRDVESLAEAAARRSGSALRRHLGALRIAVTAVMLTWVFYDTSLLLLHMFWRTQPLPGEPVVALEPFRIANQYGLFAVMTPHRYEIEFQGSNDGATWVAYPFRYKPQNVSSQPGLYAPYQPRFDWNLWFASLGAWPEYPIVPRTEELLLTGDPDVLQLFAANPFPRTPPRYLRAVLWQYWFTSMAEKHATGKWWRRQLVGTYAPTIQRMSDGRFVILQDATLSGPQ